VLTLPVNIWYVSINMPRNLLYFNEKSCIALNLSSNFKCLTSFTNSLLAFVLFPNTYCNVFLHVWIPGLSAVFQMWSNIVHHYKAVLVQLNKVSFNQSQSLHSLRCDCWSFDTGSVCCAQYAST